jgi:cell wall-associated NlpC family hydrolase
MIDINKFIGIPFALGGRDTTGIDCWGLVMAVYKDLGRAVPDFDTEFLSRPEILRQIRDHEYVVADEIAQPEPWCIVSDSSKGHVGIWVNGSVLHAARGLGVVMQPFDMFKQIYHQSRFYRCHG